MRYFTPPFPAVGRPRAPLSALCPASDSSRRASEAAAHDALGLSDGPTVAVGPELLIDPNSVEASLFSTRALGSLQRSDAPSCAGSLSSSKFDIARGTPWTHASVTQGPERTLGTSGAVADGMGDRT